LACLNHRNVLAALAQLALLALDSYVGAMPIDAKRLTKDCARAHTALAANGNAYCRTGATAIIEPVLPLIRDLRKQKHSWEAIAVALGRQGVVQGVDRKPITPRRLTALIAAIDKRERRRAKHLASRFRRQDLAPSQTKAHTLALSTDLVPTEVATRAVTDSEEQIRRRDFQERVQSLMKEDAS
jgi:hypothetical protein